MSPLNKKPSEPEELEIADHAADAAVPIRHEAITMVSHPRSHIAEQFRTTRNSISALNPEGAPRTVVITSATRGEGKSVVTINLGIAMTEVPGTHVLLVDGDLHRPALEGYMGLPRRQGLTELLRGKLAIDKAIRQTSIKGLSILGPGVLPRNSSELLGSDRMRSVLHSLKQRYSYVLIDTPEALSTSDAGLLGGMADGILLAVRLGETPRYFVEQASNQLQSLGGNMLGLCLTHAKEADMTSSQKA